MKHASLPMGAVEIGTIAEAETDDEEDEEVIEGTLRSLLNELARLTVFSTVKRASSFNRDLRVCAIFLENLNFNDWENRSVMFFSASPRISKSFALESSYLNFD